MANNTPSLSGARIINTRPSSLSRPLSDALRTKGAVTFDAPTIRILPPLDTTEIDRSIRSLSDYDWIIFTSVNAVQGWFARRDELGGNDTLSLGTGPRVVAVGPATEKALRERMGESTPILVPRRYLADDIPPTLLKEGSVKDARVLLPRADIAREELPIALRRAGALVDNVNAYRTLTDPVGAERAVELVQSARADIVTFTSASTVRGFLEAFERVSSRKPFETASIGPVTSEELRTAGIEPWIEAIEHTVHGLVEALVVAWKRRKDQ